MKFINKRQNNFTTIPNELILDKGLSCKDKGLLIYMLSRPPDWQFYEVEIIKHCTDGRDSIRSGIKSLIKANYIKRHRVRDEHGQFREYIYEVYDTPNRVTRIAEYDSTSAQDAQEDLRESFWQADKSMAERDIAWA